MDNRVVKMDWFIRIIGTIAQVICFIVCMYWLCQLMTDPGNIGLFAVLLAVQVLGFIRHMMDLDVIGTYETQQKQLDRERIAFNMERAEFARDKAEFERTKLTTP